MQPSEAEEASPHLDPERIALGIRQPWAELILRGVKTIEVRTVDTRLRGPIYLYTSKTLASQAVALRAIERHHLETTSLPCGLLVGTVDLVSTGPVGPEHAEEACLPAEFLSERAYIGWRLARPRRLPEPLPVRFLPYGVWFYPFRRRNGGG